MPNDDPADIVLKGVGKLQIHMGCKGYGATAILYSSVNVNSTSTPVSGDFLSQVTLPYDCCEELSRQINLSTLSIYLAYHKTVSHLDDLKYASRKLSELLEEVKEQERRDSHTMYHDTHSALLFVILSIVFLYLLYKLYTCMRRRATIWFGKTDEPSKPAEVSYSVGLRDKGGTVNINIRNSNDSLQLADDTPESPKRSLQPRVAKSYF